jgi:hypothetical protein
VNWYNNRLLPLIRHFFLVPNGINEFMDLSTVSPPVWISYEGIWSLPGDLNVFNFAIAISTSRWLGPGTNGSAVCTSISLPSLIRVLYPLNSWEKHFFHLFKKNCGNLQADHHSHPWLSYIYVASPLWIYSSTQVSNVPVLTVHWKLIHLKTSSRHSFLFSWLHEWKTAFTPQKHIFILH